MADDRPSDGSQSVSSDDPSSTTTDDTTRSVLGSFVRTGLAGRERPIAGLLAVAVGVGTILVSTQLFPYHSLNHDESVYLTQAAMLLEGRLVIRPPVPEAFRPWFFVRRPDGALYPKYAPVPAAMFALGKLAGSYRLALGAIAAGNVALCYTLASQLFDRRRGLLAAVLLAASPLFVFQSAVFLPYAPTTGWNLTFAVAYLRADRTGRLRWAAVAGGAVAVAFFARPFTAVLFAAPFVAHALWTLRTGGGTPAERDETTPARRTETTPATADLVTRVIRRLPIRLDPAGVRRGLVTATLGLAGVAVTLAYNAHLTGAPTRFPYQAFAPLDGIGFGYREILDYGRDYTPTLALRANAAVVSRLFGRWVAGGPVGTLFALVGLAALARRTGVASGLARRVGGLARSGVFDGTPTSGRSAGLDGLAPRAVTARRLALAGTFLTVVAGNVAFWGNLNVLGSLGGGGFGLIDALGPYYHFDLLVATAVFGADGAIRFVHTVTARLPGDGSDRPTAGRLLRVGLTVAVVLAVVVPSAGYAAGPIERNADVTRTYESAYAVDPPRDAVVFLPTPLGDWLGHPYQAYRNDPTFDEGTLYAVPERQFAVARAFPDRQLYRYGYRGAWNPLSGSEVTPHLQRVELREGQTVRLQLTVRLPRATDTASLRVSEGDSGAAFAVDPAEGDDTITLTVRLTANASVGSGSDGSESAPGDAAAGDRARVTVEGPLTPVSGDTVTVADRDRVTLRLFADYGTGAGLTYRVVLPVRVANGTVQALSPELESCERPQLCGGEAAYVPGESPGKITARLTTGEGTTRNRTATTTARGTITTSRAFDRPESV